MLAQKALLVDLEPPFATVTLNHPERRNALSLQLMQELASALKALGDDTSIRVVVLRAEGPVFSSGHDLSELVDSPQWQSQQIFDSCVALMETVQAIPQPVIAEVGGIATAAGCQLVASCDLAVASDNASFATPGVKIGLFCSTPMVALSRSIGRKRALEMLLTGDLIDARTAAEWGLVNRVVAPDQLGPATRELAQKISAASSHTVKIGKQAFYRQIDLPQHEAYEHTGGVMVENTQTQDAQEGMTAFLEKRAPIWSERSGK